MDISYDYAICPYCGQVFTSVSGFESETESREAGAMRCKCSEAIAYQQRKKAAEEGKENLKMLIEDFENNYGTDKIGNDLIEFLESGINLLADKKVKKLTAKLGNMGTVSLSLNGDFKIVIKRSVTFEEQI